jgi:hypothetical protein
MYLEYKNKKYWWQMIQLLPSSYNQKRTVTMNYENIFNMLQYREGHKLDEWNDFCEMLKVDMGFQLHEEIVYLIDGYEEDVEEVENPDTYYYEPKEDNEE